MKTYLLERETQSKISRLRELLGLDVVLLPCAGKRPTVPSWQKFTAEMMNDATYLKRLNAAPNIGVLLGSPSNGLCVVDFDVDGADDDFLTRNPSLAGTLRTRGRRGSAVWIRCEGNFPASTKLKRGGKDLGEWRATGNQSIICGEHPDTGEPYQFLNEARPIEISFAELVWPEGVHNPTPTTLNKSLLSLCHSVDSAFSVLSVNTPDEDEIVKLCAAPDAHTSHRKLFDLARGALSLERGRGRALSESELESFFGKWYEISLPNLRLDLSRRDYFDEFLEACDCAEHGLDESALLTAWGKAKNSGPPIVAADFKSPRIRQLISLCWHLQQHQCRPS